MTSTKLPPDSELATPIGGKVPDPELEAKLTDDKQRHKRDRFKALKLMLKEARKENPQGTKQVQNLEINYVLF